MKCRAVDCRRKATLHVEAWGENAWNTDRCDRCAAKVIRLRGRLIRKYKQNVVVRPVTKLDTKRRARRIKAA